MTTRRLFLYAFIGSIFLGDILIFKGLWTYGLQGIYHILVPVFFIFIVISKESIAKLNLKIFTSCLIGYFLLFVIVLLNALPYEDKSEYYKRNITFVFLMFASTFPLLIFNRNFTDNNHITGKSISVNHICAICGTSAILTGLFVLVLRIIEVGDIVSAFRFQLDTIPAACHLKLQKYVSDVSSVEFSFLNLKYILYNQIGLRMVWGLIFLNSCMVNGRNVVIKHLSEFILFIFIVISGSRESWIMLFLYLFLKLKPRKKIQLIIAVILIIALIYSELYDLYFSDSFKELPILGRLNIIFEFPDTVKSARLILWENALVLLQIDPLIGIGPHGFIFYSSKMFNSIIYNADNALLGLPVAFGFSGLLIILRILFRPIQYICKEIKRVEPGTIKSLFSGCIAYLLTSFIAPHFMWPYSSIDAIFWLAISLIILSLEYGSSDSVLKENMLKERILEISREEQYAA
ncbi:MAG: O-antigen ligase family protein [Bacteroidota bacterium]|nr:O-antigen ligase family protein [Bacteroidota bacterium]